MAGKLAATEPLTSEENSATRLGKPLSRASDHYEKMAVSLTIP